jgi:hypothetical protein
LKFTIPFPPSSDFSNRELRRHGDPSGTTATGILSVNPSAGGDYTNIHIVEMLSKLFIIKQLSNIKTGFLLALPCLSRHLLWQKYNNRSLAAACNLILCGAGIL